MVVSCDVYRPAAIEQLRTVAGEVGATFFPSTPEQQPLEIARGGGGARKQFKDVLIVDTAGRLAIDDPMMARSRPARALSRSRPCSWSTA
jgi:signal recognition particle subunit SRP54